MIVTVRREGGEARSVEVARGEALLGKLEECDVVLADPKVSRRHAKVVLEGERLSLEDLGSTNGTYVAGRKIDQRVIVSATDEIEIGPFRLTIAMGSPAAVSEPEPVTSDSDTLVPSPSTSPRAGAAKGGTAIARAAVPSLDGFGPIAALLADDTVSEIMVNGPGEVFVERGGRLELTTLGFPNEDALRELIHKIARDVGREVSERRPLLDARLKDGSRVNAVWTPLALRGPYLTIRRFPKDRLTATQLAERGTLSRPMLDFLRAAVAGRQTILVSGGTGSGKTTMLSALCEFIAPEERVVTIEDAAELRLPQRHVLPLESRPPDPGGEGEISIRELVRNALRMRPDRIVVGEVRGGEALDMLQALNTGHQGSLSTIHANAPREALSRLETLVVFAGADIPARAIREQIVGAIRLLVHTARTGDGRRRVTSIAELSGLEGDQFTTGEIFRFDPADGGFAATGYVPRVRDRLVEAGVTVDNAWFQPGR